MVLVSQIFPWLCVVLCDFFGFILIVLNKKFFLFVKKIYKDIFFVVKAPSQMMLMIEPHVNCITPKSTKHRKKIYKKLFQLFL